MHSHWLVIYDSQLMIINIDFFISRFSYADFSSLASFADIISPRGFGFIAATLLADFIAAAAS